MRVEEKSAEAVVAEKAGNAAGAIANEESPTGSPETEGLKNQRTELEKELKTAAKKGLESRA